MAKEKGRASEGHTSAARRYRELLMRIATAVAPWQRAWDSAKGMFDYKNVVVVLKDSLPQSNFYFGLAIFAVAALLSFIISSITMAETVYLSNFTSEVITEATGMVQPILGWKNIADALWVSFGISMLFGVAYDIANAGIAFSIIRLIGGKGTLTQHVYLSSLVMLGYIMSTVVGLFTPLPCIQVIAIAAIAVFTVYFSIYVIGRAYAVVHGIPLIYALAIAAVLAVGRIVVFLIIIERISSMFGLPVVVLGVGG